MGQLLETSGDGSIAKAEIAHIFEKLWHTFSPERTIYMCRSPKENRTPIPQRHYRSEISLNSTWKEANMKRNHRSTVTLKVDLQSFLI